MLDSKVSPPGTCRYRVQFSGVVTGLDRPHQTRLPSTPTPLADGQLPKFGSRDEDPGVHPGQAFSDTDMRVASLQRDIQFLNEQHRHTLTQLHAEIDTLKRQNKGETFR